MEMLADIQKNTVDFTDNFDGTLTEPHVLPAAIPNLLVNGATGIAVGMATNIPPHNLGEVVDALRLHAGKLGEAGRYQRRRPDAIHPGTGFPHRRRHHPGEPARTAWQRAYGTGRGRVTVQARAHLEEMERGRNRIIVTELPYMTNKSSLIERIAELVRDERLEGIADLRDESDRQGMRIVIELTKTADPERAAARPVQAHPHADHLQHHHAGAGRWRAAPAHPEAGPARLPGPPPGGGRAGAASTTWRKPASAPTSWKGCASPCRTWTRSST